jgi:hypothetical protein
MAPQQLSIRATTLQHSTCATTDPGILLTFLTSCSFLLIVQLHALLADHEFLHSHSHERARVPADDIIHMMTSST